MQKQPDIKTSPSTIDGGHCQAAGAPHPDAPTASQCAVTQPMKKNCAPSVDLKRTPAVFQESWLQEQKTAQQPPSPSWLARPGIALYSSLGGCTYLLSQANPYTKSTKCYFRLACRD